MMKNGNQIDGMAYMRGRDDARCGLPRFPRCQHPDQYGAYNAGFRDWGKLQEFPAMLEALRRVAKESIEPDLPLSSQLRASIQAIIARIESAG